MLRRSESMTFNIHSSTVEVQFKCYFKYINYSVVKVVLCVYIGLKIIAQDKLANEASYEYGSSPCLSPLYDWCLITYGGC